MSREVIVTMRHVRTARLCAAGARMFFKRHNLDWNDFLTNGISSAEVEAIGDPIAMRAVVVAREESDRG